jgi:hypothetical protein
MYMYNMYWLLLYIVRDDDMHMVAETTRGQQLIAKRLFALLRREQNASLLRQSKVHQSL